MRAFSARVNPLSPPPRNTHTVKRYRNERVKKNQIPLDIFLLFSTPFLLSNDSQVKMHRPPADVTARVPFSSSFLQAETKLTVPLLHYMMHLIAAAADCMSYLCTVKKRGFAFDKDRNRP